MRFLLAFVLALGAAPAPAEELVSTVSENEVEITSSFEGETLTLFGNIEPDPGGVLAPPYHVIVAVEGPQQDRVARLKTSQLGFWINTQQVTFENFPSFFHVLSSDRLTDISDVVTLTIEGILPDSKAIFAAQADWWTSSVFGRELVRLMTERGQFRVNAQGVQFLSDTSYVARLSLPSGVTNGSYIAYTYVFRDGAIVARDNQAFSIRKIGFERFLANSAIQYPLLYGLACVALALGTGWLGGWIFKR